MRSGGRIRSRRMGRPLVDGERDSLLVSGGRSSRRITSGAVVVTGRAGRSKPAAGGSRLGPRGSFDERAVSDPSVIRERAISFISLLFGARSRAAPAHRCREDRGDWVNLGRSYLVQIRCWRSEARARSTNMRSANPRSGRAEARGGCSIPVGARSAEQDRAAKSSDGVHWERDTSFQGGDRHGGLGSSGDVRSDGGADVATEQCACGSVEAMWRGRIRGCTDRSAWEFSNSSPGEKGDRQLCPRPRLVRGGNSLQAGTEQSVPFLLSK